jgi:hypothetical protein
MKTGSTTCKVCEAGWPVDQFCTRCSGNESVKETTIHKDRARSLLAHWREHPEVAFHESDLEDAFRTVEREALERAAKLCEESGAAYRELQVRAREAGDTHGALAHLCEKDACFQMAREIRALTVSGGFNVMTAESTTFRELYERAIEDRDAFAESMMGTERTLKAVREERDALKAENAMMREWVAEIVGAVPADSWTDHPAISYHEVQVDKDTLAEMRALLAK